MMDKVGHYQVDLRTTDHMSFVINVTAEYIRQPEQIEAFARSIRCLKD